MEQRAQFLPLPRTVGHGFLTWLQTALDPLATLLCLIASIVAWGHAFRPADLVLGVMAALLVYSSTLMPARRLRDIARGVMEQWLKAAGALWILGLATGMLDLFDPHVLLTWFLATPILQIAAHLPKDLELTVLTNDLAIANQLAAHESVALLMLGGTLRRKNMSLYGLQAERAMGDLSVDKLFLGVDGFDLLKGVTTHFEPEAVLNRMMCEAAAEIIVVTDSSKFGKVWGTSCLGFTLEACKNAIEDCGIPRDEIDGCLVSMPAVMGEQHGWATRVAAHLGLEPRPVTFVCSRRLGDADEPASLDKRTHEPKD